MSNRGKGSRSAPLAICLAALPCLSALLVTSCLARSGETTAEHGSIARRPQRDVRVALLTNARRVSLSATGAWLLSDEGGTRTLARGGADDVWTVEPTGGMLRAIRADAMPTTAQAGPFVARPLDSRSLVSLNGKRYRGDIVIVPTDSGLLVVNRLDVESYLRGVVPLEIGTRRLTGEAAAIAAQAVAARSYTYIRLGSIRARPFDLVATVFDQVYGGADSETALADEAVSATRGLVLTYAGRIVNAPYHSTCGGSTAAASEVWQRTPDEPFLRAVSDRIPGSERFYCDVSPRFRWTRTYDRAALAATLTKYLGAYNSVSSRGVGTARSVSVNGNTPSGRVRTLDVLTDEQRYTLRGNDIRFVLRSPGGEILNSTYFTAHAEHDASGAVFKLTIRGAGYGHGVGMCQWGAIGRARAGQDFRTILRTYYPGTTVATVD